MITGLLVIGLFFFATILAFLERYMGEFRKPAYFFLGAMLILVAGLREIGIDPDSANYEYNFLYYDSASSVNDSVEFSFLWFSAILNVFTDDVHVLFLLYAFLGLVFKFIAFRQLNDLWFLSVVTYISYYFIAHEMMQIRTGVMSGLFLMAIYQQVQGKKITAMLLILFGAFFHYSAIALLPLLLLSSDYMTKKARIIWALAIPLSYVIYFLGIEVFMSLDIPYIGNKLSTYQKGTEKGIVDAYVNVFRPLHLFSIALIAYILYFYDIIFKYNKNISLMLKIAIIGVCAYETLAFLPVLAQRINQLFLVVTIPLYVSIYYTLRPKWAALLFVTLISFVYLNYALPLISFHLLWKG